jgi:hypothetical protein
MERRKATVGQTFMTERQKVGNFENRLRFPAKNKGFPRRFRLFAVPSFILVCLSFVFSAGQWGNAGEKTVRSADPTKSKARDRARLFIFRTVAAPTAISRWEMHLPRYPAKPQLTRSIRFRRMT